MEISFSAMLGLKIKIVSFSWNLVLGLTQIPISQWWCSLFPFLNKSVLFMTNCLLNVKFGTYTNSNMQNSMAMFTFYVLIWKYSFWVNLVPKFKIASLSWNLVPRLFWMCKIQWWCFFFVLDLLSNVFSKISI